jgi:hypothetical protein
VAGPFSDAAPTTTPKTGLSNWPLATSASSLHGFFGVGWVLQQQLAAEATETKQGPRLFFRSTSI